MTQGTGVQTRLGSSRARAVWVLVCAIGTIALMAAVACGDVIVPPKEPDSCKLQVVDMTILASQRLNPTDLGEPRPGT